jgi:GH15 family glucan-1,4-alpha-glucosidase
VTQGTVHRSAHGYLPISSYGLIGDCRSAALVGADGSIDWLCLPRFDDASLFGRILDARRGGYWQIRPEGRHVAKQQYRDRSNLLRTVYSMSSGVVTVLDFMPVTAPEVEGKARARSEPRLVRLIECLSGQVGLESIIDPAPDYGRAPNRFACSAGHFHGDIGSHHFCIQSSIPLVGAHQRFTITAGETIAFSLRVSRAGHCSQRQWSAAHAQRLARDTQEYWWRWIGGCTYDGPFQEHVWRSALALKLLTYAPTGAIIAAPTTSLPERIGSHHNYDYRFTWLRDAAFTLYAFFQLGLIHEADAFFKWLRLIGLDHPKHDIPNLYTLDGRATAPESTLDNLSGYRGSRPVRIGNAAANQLQLDIYGELLDSAYLYARFGGEITAAMWDELRPVVELAIERWAEPDRSIWEPRGGDQHYTYSKLMCWVAVDRGLRIARHFKLPHRERLWVKTRREIHSTIQKRGWNTHLGAFTQTLDGDTLDAAVLRMSQTRFLPDHDVRMKKTVAAVGAQLSDGGVLVRRYLRSPNDQGRASAEGSFLMCSFWLADAMAHIGELDRAQSLFERLLALGSPLGLFAEEADSVTGDLLGNYPQAFTHLALVGAAVNIERARNHTLGERGLPARKVAARARPSHGRLIQPVSKHLAPSRKPRNS